MYQAESAAGLFRARVESRTPARARLHVSRNVVLLGLTSLLTDISAEMVATVLPVYLIFALGASPLQYGIVEGLYQGGAALVRLLSGVVADRWGRYKGVAALGYGLSAACKAGLIAIGGSVGGVTAVVAADRVGKGIRTAPRDALISLSTLPDRLGTAFGVHRAMDTAGAMLGPLVAFGILVAAPAQFDAVFAVSFCFAILGLAVLLLFVKNRAARPAREPSRRAGVRSTFALLRAPRYRMLVVIGGVLSLVTISDAFLYLGIQRRMDLDPAVFPLLFVGSALSFMLLAIPAGQLADRIGRVRMFVLGYGLLLVVYTALLVPELGLAALFAYLVLLGAYYAATDGVLMAAASAVLPEERRGSGMGLLVGVITLGKLCAAIGFGLLWTATSLATATLVFVCGLALAILVTLALIASGRVELSHA